MSIFTIILLAFSLSVDAFVITLVNSIETNRDKKIFKLALWLGIMHGILPILGWFIGTELRHCINLDIIGLYISPLLLFIIGFKTILDAVKNGDDEFIKLDNTHILYLSFIAGLDTLVIGFSLSLLHTNIFAPALIMGIVTYGVSMIAYFISSKINHSLHRYAGIIGGIVIILISVKTFI